SRTVVSQRHMVPAVVEHPAKASQVMTRAVGLPNLWIESVVVLRQLHTAVRLIVPTDHRASGAARIGTFDPKLHCEAISTLAHVVIGLSRHPNIIVGSVHREARSHFARRVSRAADQDSRLSSHHIQ